MRAWSVKDELGNLFISSVSITKHNAKGWAEDQAREMRRINKPDTFIVVPVEITEVGDTQPS